MKLSFTRIMHDKNKKTSFEKREVPMQEREDGFGFLTDYLGAEGVGFWAVSKGYVHTHNAIRTQLVMLGGPFKVTTTNGDVRIFETGDLVLPEDPQGDGHTVEYLGEDSCTSVFVVLTREGMGKLLEMSNSIDQIASA